MSTKGIMRSHWVGFLFLLPAVVMLIVHHQLGLSDALNIPTPPGEREAHLFNLVMVTVFWLGVTGYFLHALSLRNQGWRWLVAKLLLLGLYWGAVLKFG